MDITSLATALMASTTGQVQLGAAGRMLGMSLDSDRSAVQLIDAAEKNIDQLANVAAGIGTNLDMTV